jgi:hypothetical protein
MTPKTRRTISVASSLALLAAVAAAYHLTHPGEEAAPTGWRPIIRIEKDDGSKEVLVPNPNGPGYIPAPKESPWNCTRPEWKGNDVSFTCQPKAEALQND